MGPGILLVRGGGHLGHILLQGLRASTLEDFARSPPLGDGADCLLSLSG